MQRDKRSKTQTGEKMALDHPMRPTLCPFSGSPSLLLCYSRTALSQLIEVRRKTPQGNPPPLHRMELFSFNCVRHQGNSETLFQFQVVAPSQRGLVKLVFFL